MDNINDIPINQEMFYKEPINDEYEIISDSTNLKKNYFLNIVLFTIGFLFI